MPSSHPPKSLIEPIIASSTVDAAKLPTILKTTASLCTILSIMIQALHTNNRYQFMSSSDGTKLSGNIRKIIDAELTLDAEIVAHVLKSLESATEMPDIPKMLIEIAESKRVQIRRRGQLKKVAMILENHMEIHEENKKNPDNTP